jgi:HEAT repeat protein
VSLVEGRVDWATHLEELRPLRPVVDAAALRQLLMGAAKPLAEGLSSALGRHRDLVLRLLQGLDGARQDLALPMLGARPSAAERVALRPALGPLGEVIVAALDDHCRSEDPDIRAHALRLAAKVDHPRLPGLVKRGLGDAEALVRRAAGASAVIAAARQPSLREALVALLLEGFARQPWYEQRERLVRLGELGSARAVPALLPLASSSQGFLAEAAVRALGQIGDARASAAVALALRYPVARVRLAAVEALGRLDPARARRELPTVAAQDRDPQVRAAAARVLAPKGP